MRTGTLDQQNVNVIKSVSKCVCSGNSTLKAAAMLSNNNNNVSPFSELTLKHKQSHDFKGSNLFFFFFNLKTKNKIFFRSTYVLNIFEKKLNTQHCDKLK